MRLSRYDSKERAAQQNPNTSVQVARTMEGRHLLDSKIVLLCRGLSSTVCVVHEDDEFALQQLDGQHQRPADRCSQYPKP